MMVSALVAASLTLMPVDSAVAAVSPEEPAPIVEAVASDVDLQAIENAKHPEWFFDDPVFEVHDFSAIAQQEIYGTSGEGRPLVAYRLGEGNNHLILNFAIHGWEDNYANSGRDIERMGELTLAYFSNYEEMLAEEDWSIFIIPTSNPDGLLNGYTDYGPGRCTTTRFADDGVTVIAGGVDLNRSFPYRSGDGTAAFQTNYSARYYTGATANSCLESIALKNYLDSHVSETGQNVFIDVHGYYSQILTACDTPSSTGYGSELFRIFEQHFHYGQREYYAAAGYVTKYAHDFLGMDSCLFEFPYNCSYDGALFDYGYDQKFIQAITTILYEYPRP